jgi:sorting nexin-9/18/33
MSGQTPPTPPGLSSLFYSFTRAFSFSPAPQQRTKSFASSLDFDAGTNTSAAWTEHRERESILSLSAIPPSLSDDEPDDDDDDGIESGDIDGRNARVLHRFDGKPEFRELSVDAGDEIEIVREDAGDGWSLVRNAVGEMGLLPQTYYTVCASSRAPNARLAMNIWVPSPTLPLPLNPAVHQKSGILAGSL